MEIGKIIDLGAIDMLDVVPLAVAFVLGLGARFLGLPPLVGFLLAGFLLGALGVHASPSLHDIADLGITLLLFTIGLKFKPRQLLLPAIWGTAGVHLVLSLLLVALPVLVLATFGLSLFAGVGLTGAALIGFALSFSSTVFAVKVLEEHGEMESLHGRIAVGVLIMQDLFAVVFLAISAGKLPSPWALALLALIPARPLLIAVLERAGHGELLVLLGWLLPLAGAALFDAVGVKADLGALLLGVLLSGHPKTDELAKTLLSFKDLFLIGFFLTIGLGGHLSWAIVGVSLVFLVLLPAKVVLYFGLLTRFRLRARSATLASLGLANFSEFGLIVGALCAERHWLAADWLSVFAVTLSMSFVLAAPLNQMGRTIYHRWRPLLRRFQRAERLPGDELIDPGRAEVVVFGMGRVGSAAYDYLRERWGDVVLGIDRDPALVESHAAQGRTVILGDATDYDFWFRAESQGRIRLALLTFPDHEENLEVAKLFREFGFHAQLASVVKFPDQERVLREAGVQEVFNLYAEAGIGFAEHVWERMEQAGEAPAP